MFALGGDLGERLVEQAVLRQRRLCLLGADAVAIGAGGLLLSERLEADLVNRLAGLDRGLERALEVDVLGLEPGVETLARLLVSSVWRNIEPLIADSRACWVVSSRDMV